MSSPRTHRIFFAFAASFLFFSCTPQGVGSTGSGTVDNGAPAADPGNGAADTASFVGPDVVSIQDTDMAHDPGALQDGSTDEPFDDGFFEDVLEPADPGPDPDPDEGPGDPDVPIDPPPPADPNAGWIGGACDSDPACDFDGGECLQDSAGFPGGMCTQACEKFCPDFDGPGHPVTFCVNGSALGVTGPRCVARCNFNVYAEGCREGYHCEEQARANDPGTVKYVCLPGSGPEITGVKCYKDLAAMGVEFTPEPNKMESPKNLPNLTCDIPDAVSMKPWINGVTYKPSEFSSEPKNMYGACRLAKALHATSGILGVLGVTELAHYGTYNCRVIAGTTTLSEHGLGSAIDIAGLKLASGPEYWVIKDWEHDTADPGAVGAQLLYDFVWTLFGDGVFNIILTPDYDDCSSKAHDNHFHVDLTWGAEYISGPGTCP